MLFILLCRLTAQETYDGDMAVEVESSHQITYDFFSLLQIVVFCIPFLYNLSVQSSLGTDTM